MTKEQSFPTLTSTTLAKRRKKRRTKGFSLLEVMISSTIFLVAIAGTLSAYNTLSTQRAHQRYMVHALLVAEGHLEESLVYLKTDPVLVPGTSTSGIAFYDGKGRKTPVASFFRVDISSDNHAVVDDVIVVTVKVLWTENGIVHSFSLTTDRA